jgi:hypothetical protein
MFIASLLWSIIHKEEGMHINPCMCLHYMCIHVHI